MSALSQPAGVLLSSDVFHSAWFECLAAFVAFNTLIYVGLTLAKLIPWPKMMRPVEIRTWLERTLRPSTRTNVAASEQAVPVARKGGAGTASHRLPEPEPLAAPTKDPDTSRSGS